MKYVNLTIVLLFLSTLTHCASEEKFPDLGSKFSGPIDIAVSPGEEYFYALNSDFDRTYNAASLVVLDTEGEKVNTIELPRMGRSLTVVDNELFITFNAADTDSNNTVKLFDLTNPSQPREVTSWNTESCDPINVEARSGYDYFAVACQGGQLMMGQLLTPRSSSTLTQVRSYSGSSPKRALYIDPVRELLFAFSTDLNRSSFSKRPGRSFFIRAMCGFMPLVICP